MSSDNIRITNEGHTSIKLGEAHTTVVPYNPIQIGGSYKMGVVLGSDGKSGTYFEDKSGLGLYQRNYGRSGGFLAKRFNR
jgi:hypothetical protein